MDRMLYKEKIISLKEVALIITLIALTMYSMHCDVNAHCSTTIKIHRKSTLGLIFRDLMIASSSNGSGLKL